MVEIDIPRAIAQNRKIRFSYADSWKLYYDTAFGETFGIPIWIAGGAKRIALASDYESSMLYHNSQIPGGN